MDDEIDEFLLNIKWLHRFCLFPESADAKYNDCRWRFAWRYQTVIFTVGTDCTHKLVGWSCLLGPTYSGGTSLKTWVV